ncbi:MAG: sugar ABC transporter ATP-binding protein [Lentisphaerae bacterium]|nr:sugar ABC transporter ATP-binding protein [Lentisphaerota bacterium]
MSDTVTSPAVQFKGVSKRFPGVQALDRVTLDIAGGSCHGLVGENGAGKSTLGKILAGIYTPDAGELRVAGRPVRFTTPREAARAGVGMVHQELLFCENLSVAENICLEHLPSRGPFLARTRLRAEALRWLEGIGAAIEPDRILGELPISQRQIVQIAAAVARGANIMVFDEPTSSLSRRETDRLFELVRRLREKGVTIVYISHRLDELFALCDPISVLRDGRLVATRPVKTLTEASLVEQMIGRPLNQYFPKHLEQAPGRELLKVAGFGSPGKFEDISFTLREREVLGVAGLVGSGRTELAEALFGLDPRARGEIHVRGERAAWVNPSSSGTGAREAMKAGLGLVPEDRKRNGLIFALNIRENISLPLLPRLSRCGWVRRRAENRIAADARDRLRIRAPGIEADTAGLSGGNQQKIVLARWLAFGSDILLVDEPTRGIDVGARAEIYGLLDELAGRGASLLLISSELPEILNLSTRILVLRNGRLAGELTREQATQDSLLRLMAGLGGA